MKERLNVLVVDDDRRMVKTICDILRIKGYGAEPAYCGEDALERVGDGKVDCVLMDIRMPGINGIDTVQKIREIAPALPVILMSAYASEEQVEEARRKGAQSVLSKPIDIPHLLDFLSILRRENSILVVDDDPAFCIMLKDILQARGYLVETETDPKRVFDLMRDNYKLMVILDLKLGKVDGIEVLREIRDRYPTKPVVLVTGLGESMGDTIRNGLMIGAYTCMHKPVESEELLRIIDEIRREKLSNALVETE